MSKSPTPKVCAIARRDPVPARPGAVLRRRCNTVCANTRRNLSRVRYCHLVCSVQGVVAGDEGLRTRAAARPAFNGNDASAYWIYRDDLLSSGVGVFSEGVLQSSSAADIRTDRRVTASVGSRLKVESRLSKCQTAVSRSDVTLKIYPQA